MTCSYVDGLDNDARQQYLAKLEAVGLGFCPYAQPRDAWKDDPKTWPKVEYGDIYCYLINSPGPFTHSQMQYYKSLEAYSFFRSGWVQTVYSQITPNGKTVFKAGVRPPQETNDPLHSPWVVVGGDGAVIAAHCDCVAGLGESCSHIAAVLFKVEAAVRLGYRTADRTGTDCTRNTCSASKRQPAPDPEPADGVQPCTAAERRRFIASLLQCDVKPVALSLLAETCELLRSKDAPSASGIKDEPAHVSIEMIKEEHAYFRISEKTDHRTDFTVTAMKEEPADFVITEIKEEPEDYPIPEIKEER